MHPISAEKSTLTLAEILAFHRVRHKPPLDRRDGRRRHDHAGPPDQELGAAAHRTCTALRPAAPDRRLEIWVQFPVLVQNNSVHPSPRPGLHLPFFFFFL